ncbi:hypothetical protein NDU88_005939 [Pleurodeles waltl]|uniref:Uncharacterized protein n=1 Tax=Pleurodeles waltl TaxID=8319 RepID=A0AAV7MED5_PLEWA|nr:hypothetical protein NDU88_005939 [Pleurodeles waltl]
MPGAWLNRPARRPPPCEVLKGKTRTPKVPCLLANKLQIPAERQAGLVPEDGCEVDRAAAGGDLRPAEAIGGGAWPGAGRRRCRVMPELWSAPRPLDFGRGRQAPIERTSGPPERLLGGHLWPAVEGADRTGGSTCWWCGS